MARLLAGCLYQSGGPARRRPPDRNHGRSDQNTAIAIAPGKMIFDEQRGRTVTSCIKSLLAGEVHQSGQISIVARLAHHPAARLTRVPGDVSES